MAAGGARRTGGGEPGPGRADVRPPGLDVGGTGGLRLPGRAPDGERPAGAVVLRDRRPRRAAAVRAGPARPVGLAHAAHHAAARGGGALAARPLAPPARRTGPHGLAARRPAGARAAGRRRPRPPAGEGAHRGRHARLARPRPDAPRGARRRPGTRPRPGLAAAGGRTRTARGRRGRDRTAARDHRRAARGRRRRGRRAAARGERRDDRRARPRLRRADRRRAPGRSHGRPPGRPSGRHRRPASDDRARRAPRAPGGADERRQTRSRRYRTRSAHVDDGVVTLRVVNDPAPAAAPTGVASGGSGLVGLAERVRLAGGVLRPARFTAGVSRSPPNCPSPASRRLTSTYGQQPVSMCR